MNPASQATEASSTGMVQVLVPLRDDIRAFARRLLTGMSTGVVPTVEQAATMSQDLVDFATTPDYTAHKLKCIRLRIEEVRGNDTAGSFADEAKALIARLKTEPLDGDRASKGVGSNSTDLEVDTNPESREAEILKLVRRACNEIEDLGLSILELSRVRHVFYPIVNTGRVGDAKDIAAVLKELATGNGRALEYVDALQKMLEVK